MGDNEQGSTFGFMAHVGLHVSRRNMSNPTKPTDLIDLPFQKVLWSDLVDHYRSLLFSASQLQERCQRRLALEYSAAEAEVSTVSGKLSLGQAIFTSMKLVYLFPFLHK